MPTEKHATMKEVRLSFASWKAVADRIAIVKAALDDHDPERDAPIAQLEADLLALNVEAERLLLLAQQALLKIKTPRSSNGDSTWG